MHTKRKPKWRVLKGRVSHWLKTQAYKLKCWWRGEDWRKYW